MKLTYVASKKDIENSINHILSTKLNLSTRLQSKLIKNEKIAVNQKLCNTKNLVNCGDIITIDFDYSEENKHIIATPMKLNIVYEDEWFLVVNKPPHMPIHPSCRHYKNSLSNGIKAYFDSISLPKKIRPVNRLDLDTSGLVIFAKCEYIQESFIQQMKQKIFQKEYLCFINRYVREKIRHHFSTNC